MQLDLFILPGVIPLHGHAGNDFPCAVAPYVTYHGRSILVKVWDIGNAGHTVHTFGFSAKYLKLQHTPLKNYEKFQVQPPLPRNSTSLKRKTETIQKQELLKNSI